MTIVEVSPSSSLSPHISDWLDLVQNSVEPNVFFEPWAFIPAWKHLASAEQRCLFIYSDSTPQELIGFIPLSSSKIYRHLPIYHLGVWRHLHCFLATPLVRRGAVEAVLDQLFNWVDEFGRGYLGFEFPYLYSDGGFASELRVYAAGSQRTVDELSIFERAYLYPDSSAEEYLERSLKRKHRKDLDRKMELLEKSGSVDLYVFDRHEQSDYWIETFLNLERSGWKGSRGTSLTNSTVEREFFINFIQSGVENGKLVRQLLTVGDLPICARISILNGEGALSFKTAFDETRAKFSPGMLLEIANLRWAFAQTPPLPMDSCAAPDAELFRRLWRGSKQVESLMISKSSLTSKVVTKMCALFASAIGKVKGIRIQ